jgi:hypothetical protein
MAVRGSGRGIPATIGVGAVVAEDAEPGAAADDGGLTGFWELMAQPAPPPLSFIVRPRERMLGAR